MNSCGREAAHEDETVSDVCSGVASPRERRVVGIDLEETLDARRYRAEAQHPRVRAGPKEQTEPGDDHRLAGPRLPGKHCEAGGELESRVLDDAQPRDPQLGEHQVPLVAAPMRAAPRHP